MRGDKVIGHALVDDEDYERLSKYTWRLHSKGYATRSSSTNGKETRLMMHREILDTGEFQVDHIDRNKLNNQKDNLRIATNSINQFNKGKQKNNTSGTPGVFWDRSKNVWRARIQLDGKRIELGRFRTVDEAAKAVGDWRNKNL
jgi:hypothetical protein